MKRLLTTLGLLSTLVIPALATAQPDLTVSNITSDPMIFSGRDTTVTFTITNLGTAVNPSTFEFRVYLSDNRVITLNDLQLYAGSLPSAANVPGTPTTLTVSIPSGINEGGYYLGVIVDAGSVIDEPNEVNNARRGELIQVRTPAPDLTAAEVRIPPLGAAGEAIAVTFTMENRGNEPATFEYGVYLSHNSTISPEDLLLFRGQRNLTAGTFQTRSDYVHLSPTLPEGEYYLGLVLDPDGLVHELDETNNAQASPLPLQVLRPELAVITTFVPEAVVSVPFDWRFAAIGGTGNYSFALTSGSLPPGLALDGATGDVTGTPTAAGEYRFVLEVTSGAQSAATGYTILVSEPTVSLSVLTGALPPGVLQQAYSTRLAAVGGAPPYSWTELSGRLPGGLILSQDGVLSGAPTLVGSFSLEIEVSDARGEIARVLLPLKIVDQGILTITTGFLPVGQVEQAYIAGFEVVGGEPPMTWSLVGGELPPGIALEPNVGILSGAPLGAGRYRFQVQVTDSGGLFDTNNYVIESLAQPLAIVTAELDPAQVGEEYAQNLNVLPSSGEGPFTWRIRSGEVPEGLDFDGSAGTITGTPAAGSAGTYNLLLEATDVRGAFGRRAFVLEVRDPALQQRLAMQPEDKGCSSASGEGLLALVGILALGLLRRRRRAGGLLLLAAALALPGVSRAQGNYSVSIVPETYVAVSGGTPVSFSSSDEATTTVDLPFVFSFWGVNYTQVTISTNGFVAFGGSTGSNYSNDPIPDASTPNGFVALFWDDLAAGSGQVVTAVQGSAPNRAFVIEYANWSRYGGGNTFSMKLRLYETTNVIRVSYGGMSGTSSMSASAGIENQAGTAGLEGLMCTPACTASAWPTNMSIIYSRDPDIATLSATAPTTVFGSVPAQIDAEIANLGGKAAGPFVVGALLSNDTTLDAADRILSGQADVNGLATGEVRHISFLAQLPADLQPNVTYYLFVVANLTSTVQEGGLTNNTYGPLEIRSGPPTANLRVSPPTASQGTAAPGTALQVTLRIENTGNLDAASDFAVVLSGNSVISTEDLALASGTLSLAPQEVDQRTISVTLPSTLAQGVYYLGLIADTQNTLDEPDEADNAAASLATLGVVSNSMIVLTQTLPEGRVGRAYEVWLEAAGGNGTITWSLAGGSLPPGIALTGAGRLTGTPTTAGDYEIRFLAKSGAQAALVTLHLMVQEQSLPLTVVTQALPDGIFGSEYSVRLTAVGGTPPLTWALSSGTLPPGMAVLPDGILGGLSGSEGDFSFGVAVTDGDGASASRDLDLHVAQPGNLVVVTAELPRARLAEAYEASLLAAGGTPPYKWALDGPGRLPEGLTLDTDGRLWGTPTEVGVFDITVQVRDDRARFDTNTLSLTVGADQGITILTGLLPSATYEIEYQAHLTATGGQTPYTWSITGGELPAGLDLEEDGRIVGTPIGDGQETLSAFIVEAVDAAGRRDLAGLSIRVANGPVVQPRGGCDSGRGGSSSAPFLAFLLVGVAALFGRGRFGR
ncbi:MAG: putative Ig domain-containing protein [Deltaproteobacteria bacterium]|nr:putative Ig domain-containing protein [Deltaproteobacteria bacterium]